MSESRFFFNAAPDQWAITHLLNLRTRDQLHLALHILGLVANSKADHRKLSLSRISRDLGYSRATVKALKASMVNTGLLSITPAPGGTSTFSIGQAVESDRYCFLLEQFDHLAKAGEVQWPFNQKQRHGGALRSRGPSDKKSNLAASEQPPTWLLQSSHPPGCFRAATHLAASEQPPMEKYIESPLEISLESPVPGPTEGPTLGPAPDVFPQASDSATALGSASRSGSASGPADIPAEQPTAEKRRSTNGIHFDQLRSQAKAQPSQAEAQPEELTDVESAQPTVDEAQPTVEPEQQWWEQLSWDQQQVLHAKLATSIEGLVITNGYITGPLLLTEDSGVLSASVESETDGMAYLNELHCFKGWRLVEEGSTAALDLLHSVALRLHHASCT